MYKTLKNFKVKAYSLLEITIYLAIVGVLIVSISKFKDILNQTKLQKIILQIQTIHIAQQNLNEELSINNLIEYGSLSKEDTIPAIGGEFSIEKDTDNYYLILSNTNKNGILTQKQINYLVDKLGKSNTIAYQKNNNLFILKYKL